MTAAFKINVIKPWTVLLITEFINEYLYKCISVSVYKCIVYRYRTIMYRNVLYYTLNTTQYTLHCSKNVTYRQQTTDKKVNTDPPLSAVPM